MNRYWLAIILLLATFLRCFQLAGAPPGLYRDEAMNGSNALEALETGRFAVFYPENSGREGLYINVAALSIGLFDNRPWALRLPAVGFGVLTVWGLYALVAEVSTAEIALMAAFLLATSFWHINFSRIALRAIAAPCFLTWSLYLLCIGRKRASTGRRSVGIALMAGACYGSGFYTYVAYRATPLLVAFWAKRLRRKEWLCFTGAVCLATIPLAIYFFGHPGSFLGRTAQVSVLQRDHPAWEVVLNSWRTARMLFTRGDSNWRHNVAWRAELFRPVQVLLIAGLALGWRRPLPDLKPLALGWLAMAALPVVFSGEAVPHALRAILMVPPVCMIAADGAVSIYGWLSRRVPGSVMRVAAGAVLLALAYEPYHTYFDVWARNPKVALAFDAPIVEIAEKIRRLPDGVPKVVVAPDFVAAQPVMFLTGSYTAKAQRARNIRYQIGVPCEVITGRDPDGQVFCVPALQ